MGRRDRLGRDCDENRGAVVSASERLTELHERMTPAPWAYDINEQHETGSLIYDWVRFATFDGRQYLGAEHNAHPMGLLRNALPAIAAVVAAAEALATIEEISDDVYVSKRHDDLRVLMDFVRSSQNALDELNRVLGDKP